MIRRLILRLDIRSAEHPELALYAALARALDAELLAQLEEDDNLNLLASLPFVTEICRASATARPLNRENLERRAERLMRQLRNQLEEIARHTPLHWELKRVNRSQPQPAEPDTALLRTTSGGHTQTPVPTNTVSKPHLAVIHGGDDASERALDYARQISARQQLPLLLLALPSSPWHQAHDLPEGVSVRTDLAACDPAILKPMLRAWRTELLLLPAQQLGSLSEADALSERIPGIPLLLTP